MPDMLVKLYELPDLAPHIAAQNAQGIQVRRALAPEKQKVCAWVGEVFDAGWQSECEVAFARQPIACFVAVEGQNLIGFACYEVTAKGFFGPTGVSEAARGRKTGQALLLVALHSLWAEGYVYGIIGGVGPAEFYTKVCGASLIEGSENGIYTGMLE